MTEKQIESLVSKWQPRLGLSEWKIEYHFEEPEDPDETARADCIGDYQVVKLYFNPVMLTGDSDFIGECSPEENEITIIHELLHVAISPMRTVRFHSAPKKKKVYDIWHKAHSSAEEACVDKLARSLFLEWK